MIFLRIKSSLGFVKSYKLFCLAIGVPPAQGHGVAAADQVHTLRLNEKSEAECPHLGYAL